LSYFPENVELEHHHFEILKKLNVLRKPTNNNRPNRDHITEQLHSFKNTQRIEETDDEVNKKPNKKLPSLSSSKNQPVQQRHGSKIRLPPLVFSPKKPFRESSKSSIRTAQKETKSNKSERTISDERTIGLLKVKTLYPGDYCGINDLLFDEQPALQLISCSCECVLLPKNLFIRYSNIDRLKDLRAFEKSYPDFESIKFTLKSYSEWKSYRKSLLMVGPEPLDSSRF